MPINRAYALMYKTRIFLPRIELFSFAERKKFDTKDFQSVMVELGLHCFWLIAYPNCPAYGRIHERTLRAKVSDAFLQLCCTPFHRIHPRSGLACARLGGARSA